MSLLRISPRYTSDHWSLLKQANSDDWSEAAKIVKDRLDGRFLRYAGNCLRSPYSGFVVLAIDSLLLETIQQFKEGVVNGHGQSEALVKRFLEGKRFQPDFNANARLRYYKDIRCGLLHQAEAKEMWLIRRNQPAMLQEAKAGKGYIIDVRKFHQAVRASLNDYLRMICSSSAYELRANLWTKMDHICNVRAQRGAIYASGEENFGI